jgi:hypothetical protein
MKTSRILTTILIISAALTLLTTGLTWANASQPGPSSPEAALGTGFTYQGYLTEGGSPTEGAYDFIFELYDAVVDGTSIMSTTIEDLPVEKGIFTAVLDFGTGAFDREERWLEISVRPGAETGEYTKFVGRQPVSPAPYALYAVEAGSVAWADINNLPDGLDDGDDNTEYDAGFGLELDGTTFNTLTDTLQTRVSSGCSAGYAIRQINADGSVVCELSDDPLASWSLTGNAGTTPGVNVLGTTNGISLTLVVNGTSALRLEPTSGTPNLIGGYSGNTVTYGVVGAVIAGGGAGGDWVHNITDNYGVIGGGYGNQAGNADSNLSDRSYATVAGGADNKATGGSSFVGGGESNTASGSSAVVSGGGSNQASANNATIGGGSENSALAYASTIGGGEGNRIENDWATIAGGSGNDNYGDYGTIAGGYNNTVNSNLGTIPGGSSNTVDEEYGFAAGRRATAAHQGAFVWADSTDAAFSSTNSNQFAVRAHGGVLFDIEGAPFLIDGADVWTSDNDGHGSGLEADLLDGYEGTDLQERVTGSCLVGSSIRTINSDGTVVCENDDGTTYTAGYGLELDGTTFNVMTDTLQARVAGNCSVGSTIRAINEDGSVVCEPHDALPVFYQAGVYSYGMIVNTSIAIGVDGFPVISNGVNNGLAITHCEDPLCTSSSTTVFDFLVGAWYTSIAIGADGLPIVSFMDVNDMDLMIGHCEDRSCSTITMNTIETYGVAGYYTSITIGSDGLPIIAYNENLDDVIKVAHCNNRACTSATINTIDNSLDSAQQLSIAIGTDGMPIISYYKGWDNGPYYDLMIAFCQDVACDSTIIKTVDSANDVGGHTSLTLGIDGTPTISYYDFTNTALKVAKCEDLTCSTVISNTLDLTGTVGMDTSITIGYDGFPIISYRDETKQDLKIAHCNDFACESVSLLTLDSSGLVGFYSSITIGVDGMHIISYSDLTNGELKIVHCSNTFCIPYWRRY